MVVDVQIDHAVIAQFTGKGRVVAVSQHALRAALHIGNIDFELNKIHVQTNTKSVQCLCINTKHNKVRITQSQ